MPRAAARALAALALVPLLAPRPARAQETPSDTLLTVQHYLQWEQVADPQISPDGARIVFTRRWVNRIEDRWEDALWMMNADGSHQTFLAKGSSARWSPDGTRIAYLADGEPKGTQIFVRWMDAPGGGGGGGTSQITHLTPPQAPGSLHWSPDGKSVAFAMVVPEEPTWKISLPAAPEGAHWTPAPRIVDRLHYRQDRRGFVEDGYLHLFLVPADGGTARQLTHGAWNVGARFDGLESGAGFDWTPDARTIVFDGLRDTTWDLSYRASQLYALDVASGAIRQITARPGLWQHPAVSPDGRQVALVGYDSTDQTYTTEALYVVGLDGSGQRKISGDLDRDVSEIAWAPDGGGVYFTVGDSGTSNVLFASLRGGQPTRVTTGSHMLTLTSLARDLVAVGLMSEPAAPPNVVRYDLRRPQTITRLTAVNDDVLGHIRLGRVEELWYPSTGGGGARIQAWLVEPPSFDASRRYPLILEIHGGPHAMYNVGFNFMAQNFAADGYLVLLVNPRGSTGYGTAFGNAINHAYPGVDYDDLMAGVDTVVGRGSVDRTRMYVSGCSGGGVLSSWVIGHTDRFAAAAVRCPVIDWVSMAGETDIPLFTYSFFDKPFWEDPQPWLRESSVMYAGRVTTPTLLMTGELDRRTPIPQSEEFYAALRVRHVPAMMLRFAGEFHGTGSKPSNFMRTQLYMMSWFQRWRRATSGAAQAASGNN